MEEVQSNCGGKEHGREEEQHAADMEHDMEHIEEAEYEDEGQLDYQIGLMDNDK